MIGILILVHHDIAEPLLIQLQNVRMLHEKIDGMIDQIVKILGIVAVKTFLILPVHFSDILFPEGKRLLLILGGRQKLLLRLGDGRHHTADRILLLIQRKQTKDLLYGRLLVVCIIDRKTVFSAQAFVEPSQDPHTHGVKCADPDGLRTVFHQSVHTVPHLPCSLVRECDRQDIVWIH